MFVLGSERAGRIAADLVKRGISFSCYPFRSDAVVRFGVGKKDKAELASLSLYLCPTYDEAILGARRST